MPRKTLAQNCTNAFTLIVCECLFSISDVAEISMQDEIEGSFLNKHFIQYCPLSQWSQNEQVDGMIWVWPICCLPSLTVLNQNQATTFFFLILFYRIIFIRQDLMKNIFIF